MLYEIVYETKAAREVDALPQHVRGDIVAAIEQLAYDPQPAAAHQLHGMGKTFTLRIGAYRALYEFVPEQGHIVVYTVQPRRDVYRRR